VRAAADVMVHGAPRGRGSHLSDPVSPGGAGPDLDGVGILVTGGAGFIGSHLVETLVRRGARVRVLDDLSSGRREHLAAVDDRCELLIGDLRDAAACRDACAGVRLVFHQAALGSVPRSLERPDETMAVNLTGTATLLTAARDAGVERVVYASSSAVYGDVATVLQREGDEGRLQSPYALSKRFGEELASSFQELFGLACIGLRYFNVYGPRQDPSGPYAAVIPSFARALLAGEAPVVHGDGGQTRDFVYVGDVVAANLCAAAAPAVVCGAAYNVAAGQGTSLLALLALLEGITGQRATPRHEPSRAGDLRHSQADTRLAAERLGFRAPTTLADGLRASLPWYRQLFTAAG
jgi:nucleoside-diphosphate-sugar epimerase